MPSTWIKLRPKRACNNAPAATLVLQASVEDAGATAELFFQIVIGHYQPLLLLCAIRPPGKAARAAHLDFAIWSFLKVIARNGVPLT